MKPKRSNPLFARFFSAGFASVIVVSGSAAEIPYKSVGTSTTDVGLNTNWQGEVLPGPGDIAAWTTAGGGGESRGGALNISAPVSWLGLRYEDSAGPIVFSGSDITLGASGITEMVWENLTINNNVILGADQTWNIGGTPVTLNGTLTGAFTLTKTGGNDLNVTSNTLGGGLVNVTAGRLILNPVTVGSTVTVQSMRTNRDVMVGNDGLLNVASGNLGLNTVGGFWIQGSGTGTNGRVTSSSGTLNVASVDNAGTVTTGNLTDLDHQIQLRIVDFNGSTALALTKTGANQLALSEPNTYTGGTTISGGRINADNLSSFGTGSVTVNSGAQAYLGAAGIFANNFTIQGNGIVETAGTLGALRFNGNNTVAGTVTVAAAGARIAAYTGAVGTITGSLAGTGPLEINSADVDVTGTINLTGNSPAYTAGITLAQGTLNVSSAVGGSVTVIAGTLGLTGSAAGNVTIPDLGTIGGEGSVTGTLNLGSVTGATLRVKAATTGALTVGTLNLVGDTLVTLDSLPTGAGPFTVIDYTTLVGDETNLKVAPGLYRNPQFAKDLVNSKITLEFETGLRTWNGTASTDWNTSDTNWVEGDFLFTVGDSVVFTNNGVGEVFLSGPLAPTSITLSNTAGNNYTFSPLVAGDAIVGSTGITMSGGGNLFLGGIAGQSYTGAVNVSAGVLTTTGQYSLGQTSGINVASGARVNLSGQTPGNVATGGYSWTIAGDGGDGPGLLGAVTNSGGDVYGSSGVKNLTLSANAEIGGNNGRFDIGAHPAGTTGTINGGNFTLTKVGSNSMVFRAPAANITYVLNSGALTFEDFDAASGTNLITVNAGTLGTYNDRTIINDVSFAAAGATLIGQAQTGTWTGAITLGGDTTFRADGNLVIDGSLAGSGNITKMGGGILALQNTSSSFSGKILTNEGTLRIEGNSALGTYGGADAITMADGTTLQGGTIAAQASATVGSAGQGITHSGTGTVFYNSGTGNTLTIGGNVAGGVTNIATQNGTVAFSGAVTLFDPANTNANLVVRNNSTVSFLSGANASVRNIGLGENGQGNNSNMSIAAGANVATSRLVTGDGGSVTSIITQTGGTFNVTGNNNSNSTGASFLMGHWGGGTSVYNLSDGILNSTSAVLSLGWDTAGANFNQSGGTANLLGINLANSRNNAAAVNLTGGRLNLGANGITNASNKAVNLGGGTLGAFASWSSDKNIALTGTGGNVSIDTLDSVDGITGRSISLTGVLSGTGGLVKKGTGNLSLSNAAGTFTGTASVEGGSLLLNAGAAATATVKAVAGGTVQPGTIATPGTGNVANLDLDGGTAAFRVGTVTDLFNVTGAFSVTSASTIRVVPGNAITGTLPQTFTLIDYAGTIGGPGYDSLNFVSANPHLQIQKFHDVPNTRVQVQILAADTITWQGDLSNDWDVNNTQNWRLDSSGGVTPSPYYDFDVVTFSDAGIGQPTVDLVGSITPATVAVTNTAGTYTLQGSGIGGTASLAKSGDGVLTLLNNNTYAGSTTINGGTVNVGTGGTTGTLGGAGNIALNAGTLVFNRSDAQALSRPAVGSGSVRKLGAGNLTLSGSPFNITGSLQIDAGIVTLTTNNYTLFGATGGIFVNNTGTLRISSVNVFNGGTTVINVNAGGTVEIQTGASGHNHFLALNLNGGTIVGIGSGMYANEYSTFDGLVTVAGSQMSSITATGPGVYLLNGGSFNVGESAVGTDLLFSGPLTGGTLTKTGVGTMTLTGNNTYTGGTAVNGGTVEAVTVADAGGAASIGTGYLAIANDGVFLYTGTTVETTARLLWMDQGTQVRTIEVVDAAGDITFTGIDGTINKPFRKAGLGALTIVDDIQPGAAITVDGGKLTLGGVNAYTGDTTVNASGTLVVDGDAIADAGKLVINGSGKVDVTGTEVVDTLFINGVQMAAGTYGFTGSGAGNIDTTHFSGTGVVQVTSNPPVGYDNWKTVIGDVNQQDREDDPDGDGFNNLQEFLFGTSPIAGTGSLVSTTASGANLVMRWLQRETGATYTLKESASLATGSWTSVLSPLPAADGDQTGAPTDYDFFKVTLPAASGKNFFRIEGVEN